MLNIGNIRDFLTLELLLSNSRAHLLGWKVENRHHKDSDIAVGMEGKETENSRVNMIHDSRCV